MSLDPSKYSTLALTHVQYDSTDPLAKLLSLVTLSPIFLLCSYMTIILYRRELTFINAFFGQLSCEAINWALKRFFRQPRPTDFLGSGYGMPSSHSQFLGFFSSFFLFHFYIHTPPLNRKNIFITTLRRLEHSILMIGIVTLTLAVCYSRYHLSYHTPSQILIGLSIGLFYGSFYYYFTEISTKLPIKIPIDKSQSQKGNQIPNQSTIRKTSQDERLRKRKTTNPTKVSSSIDEDSNQKRFKSTSKSNSFNRKPSIRRLILNHPISKAFRIRDSWLIWKDGGLEMEYEIWKSEWEEDLKFDENQSQNQNQNLSQTYQNETRERRIWKSREKKEKFEVMKLALKEADKCVPLISAFSVGCVITASSESAARGKGGGGRKGKGKEKGKEKEII